MKMLVHQNLLLQFILVRVKREQANRYMFTKNSSPKNSSYNSILQTTYEYAVSRNHNLTGMLVRLLTVQCMMKWS